MKRISSIILVVFTLVIVFVGCKKSEEFVNPVFMCECGSVNWNGTEYPLLMAEYINYIDTNLLSRRYYVTADVMVEGEIEAHNFNMTIELDTVSQSIFLLPGDDAIVLAEDVNFNDPIQTVRTFQADGGVIEIAPAILGGSESVSFNLSMQQTFDGIPFGVPIPVSGSMVVQITL
jgi:hypothetical protein